MKVNEKIERFTDKSLICGIDIGKTKCCMRFCDYRGVEVYHKVWFDRTGNLDAFGCEVTAAMHKEGKDDVIISFEPTGHYWFNIATYLDKHHIEYVLMPTATVKNEKAQYDQNPTKNDPKDSLLIARLTAQGKYVLPIERNELFENIHIGYNLYQTKLQERNAIMNKIHDWNDKFFPEIEKIYKITNVSIKPIYKHQLLPSEINDMSDDDFLKLMTEDFKRSCKADIKALKELCGNSNAIKPNYFTKLEIKQLYVRYEELEKELEEIQSELIEMASQIDYVKTLAEIPGVGYMSVIGIIAEAGDLRNYNHPKQLLKMSGLSLKESSSGQKKGKKHISKRGRALLRKVLKLLGLSLVRNNSFFMQLHNYYTTQRSNQLTKIVSINAIIRKFVYIIIGMIKNNESFNIKKAMTESCIFGDRILVG